MYNSNKVRQYHNGRRRTLSDHWRMTVEPTNTDGVLENERLTFQLGVDAQRRESPLLGGTDNGVLGRVTVGW